MKRLIAAVSTAFIFVGGSFAQDSGKKSNDTVGARASIRHSTTNLKMDTVAPKEGAQVSIDYQWSLSTLLGEPILKCNAAWTLEGVFVKRKSMGNVDWITVKDLPPKVAASVRIIDLDVNATSAYFKTSFDCDIGVAAAQGKERSWNFPTSPDWHEMFYALPAYSKEQAAKENKAKFKAMLGNADAVARLFEYQVKKIDFDLSGVRDWVFEQEQRALEKNEKQLTTPKSSAATDAKKAELEVSRTTLAATIEAAAKERDSANAALNQKNRIVEGKGKQFDNKMADLKQRNVLAGRWERDDGAIVEIDSVDKWELGVGRSRILVAPKSWRDIGLAREYKTRNIRSTGVNRYDCEDLYLRWGKAPVVLANVSEEWQRCTIEIKGANTFSLTAFGTAGGVVRTYTRK